MSCLDSRVPVEKVFDLGIGDVFVGRVAGNIVNTDLLGSMEFGCAVAGAKVIIVLGHTECGAVKAAIDNVELGNITELLSKIKPAVASLSSYTGEKTSENKEFLNMVTTENVRLTMQKIRDDSEILRNLETTMDESGNPKLKIIGGVYDVHTGIVTFLE